MTEFDEFSPLEQQIQDKSWRIGPVVIDSATAQKKFLPYELDYMLNPDEPDEEHFHRVLGAVWEEGLHEYVKDYAKQKKLQLLTQEQVMSVLDDAYRNVHNESLITEINPLGQALTQEGIYVPDYIFENNNKLHTAVECSISGKPEKFNSQIRRFLQMSMRPEFRDLFDDQLEFVIFLPKTHKRFSTTYFQKAINEFVNYKVPGVSGISQAERQNVADNSTITVERLDVQREDFRAFVKEMLAEWRGLIS